MSPLALIGILVALYVVVAIVRGEVYAKSGFRGRTIVREQDPVTFWFTVSTYALLCLALFIWA